MKIEGIRNILGAHGAKIPFGYFHFKWFVTDLRRATAGPPRPDVVCVTNDALAAPLEVPLDNQREKTAYEHILPR